MPSAKKRSTKASKPRTPREEDACRIDGAKLRRLRNDAELSVRALAFAAGVDPKTVTQIEGGHRKTSTERVARSLAAHPAIDVDYRELLVDPPASAAPRSSLDRFVDEERRVGKPPPPDTPDGPIPIFGATDLVSAFASPAARAGERFYVQGKVHAQRGLSPADGAVLGIPYEQGARFEIHRRIGTLDQPLAVTVVTTDPSTTRALQVAWEKGTETTAAVQLAVAGFPDDGHVHIRGVGALDGTRIRPSAGSHPWRGFTSIEPKTASPKPHPWTLVVMSGLTEWLAK